MKTIKALFMYLCLPGIYKESINTAIQTFYTLTGK